MPTCHTPRITIASWDAGVLANACGVFGSGSGAGGEVTVGCCDAPVPDTLCVRFTNPTGAFTDIPPAGPGFPVQGHLIPEYVTLYAAPSGWFSDEPVLEDGWQLNVYLACTQVTVLGDLGWFFFADFSEGSISLHQPCAQEYEIDVTCDPFHATGSIVHPNTPEEAFCVLSEGLLGTVDFEITPGAC